MRSIAGEPITDPLWTDETLPAPNLTTLPAIVVVIDEFADMMMIVGKKVEQLIAPYCAKSARRGYSFVTSDPATLSRCHHRTDQGKHTDSNGFSGLIQN